MYKKDLKIEHPKKFQRHVSDIAGNVLFKRGYYLSRQYSKFPFLTENAITNIANFNGLLCFVKNATNYNLISRIIGAILIVLGAIYVNYPLFASYNFNIYDLLNPAPWLIVGIGIFLILFKYGKDICIEIRLVGETYRTDNKKEENSIEYLNVRSDARLTVNANTVDPKKTLSDKDIEKLREDGSALTAELSPFLEEFLEKTNDN